MPKESTLKTMIVALVVCVTASILVASAAVLLRPIQERNRAIDRKKNILIAAGLVQEGERTDAETIERLFEKIEVRAVDLTTGKFVDDADMNLVESGALMKDPSQSTTLDAEKDIAKVRRMANLQPVYLFREGKRIERIILPIRGKGLWSTILGYIALDADGNTVQGITFYSHAETAGLGAEIDNPAWKQKWIGKRVFETDEINGKDTDLKDTDLKDAASTKASTPVIQVIKGCVDTSETNVQKDHQIDGISGATLTGRGVTNLVRFWLGPDGFGPMLKQLRKN